MIVTIIAATVVVSLVSLIGVGFLMLSKKAMEMATFGIIAFATGTLLAAAFLHLIPEAVEGIDAHAALGTTLAGILVFFVVEKFVHWHHEHHDHTTHEKPMAYLIILGDGVHNFFDGVAIAASFLASFEAGVTATIAIILHEIPQELSDFSLLLYAGFSKRKAIAANLLSALTAVVGALAFIYASSAVDGLEFYGLAFAAGGFIYIACSDLVPEFHKDSTAKSLVQLVIMLLGVLTIWAMSTFLHFH